MAFASFRHRLAYGATMFVVCGLSLLLLIYVGFGEAQRTYPSFHLEKLAAQGRIVQNAMESYLRAGLPLRQFVGFNGMAEDIIASDLSIAQIAVYDVTGQPVFAAGEEGDVPLLAADPRLFLSGEAGRYQHAANPTWYQVALPLRSRFETVGWIAVTMPRSAIADRLTESFRLPLLAVGGLSLLFAVFAAVAAPRVAGRRIPWLQIGYLVGFAAMAVLVMAQLVALYSNGAQEKSKALAASLAQRLTDIFAYNLSLGSIDGLDRVFSDYRRLNPDISAAGLIVDGVVRFHTNPDAVGKPWATSPGTYEFADDVVPPDALRRVAVTVALPGHVVTEQVARSGKNFAALFVATGFLASLFLQLAGAIHQVRNRTEPAAPAEVTGQDQVDVVRPVFFVAMFVEHLTYSFLPQFVHAAAEQAGLPAALMSSPFLIYYICFALILVPAGFLSRRCGARGLMFGGLLLSACGVLSLVWPMGFTALVAGRTLSGLGQGMLFIGVQNYILSVASPERRTQGAAIVVFGFQGGMIAGTAIGSLLVTYMGPMAVFVLAGSLGIVSALYTVMLVPPIVAAVVATGDLRLSLRQLMRDIRQVATSSGFMRAILLIGVPAKAVLTGVVVFALPLILAGRHYPQDDIGQIIMIYGLGVLLASGYASRVVDRTGRSTTALAWGALASGLGLILIGLAPATTMGTAMLIAGVAVVGLAHGCINAPIVTHIAELDVSARIGVDSVTTTYRFLERIGHAVGPVVVAQLLFLHGPGVHAMIWVGGGVAMLGLLFALRVDTGAGHMHKGASA